MKWLKQCLEPVLLFCRNIFITSAHINKIVCTFSSQENICSSRIFVNFCLEWFILCCISFDHFKRFSSYLKFLLTYFKFSPHLHDKLKFTFYLSRCCSGWMMVWLDLHVTLVLLFLVFLDLWPEGSYKIESGRPFFRLSVSFLGIGSLVFSNMEFGAHV